MIVVRCWRKHNKLKGKSPVDYFGIFLFGIIPIYIYSINWKNMNH